MTKRIIAQLLAIAMLFSLSPVVQASASENAVFLGSDIKASNLGAYLTEYSPTTVGTPTQQPQPRSPVLEATAYMGQDIRAYRMTSVYEYPNDGGSFKMDGASYFRGIVGRDSSAVTYYNIDGRYNELSG